MHLEWKLWQPKPTYVLKTLQPSTFHTLADHFAKTLNTEVDVRLLQYREQWSVFYNSVDSAAFRLYMTLYDPPQPKKMGQGVLMGEPCIVIDDFTLYPENGKVRAHLVFALLTAMESTGFVCIMVQPKSLSQARVYARLGFGRLPEADAMYGFRFKAKSPMTQLATKPLIRIRSK